MPESFICIGYPFLRLIIASASLWAIVVGSIAVPQSLSAQAVGLLWQPTVQVAKGAVYDNIRPQIALTTGNVPLVLWCRASGVDLGPQGIRKVD